MSTPDTPPEPRPDAPAEPGDGGTAETLSPQRASSTEPAPVTGAQRAIGRTLGRPRPRGRTAVGLAVLAACAVVLVPVGIASFHGGSAAGPSTPTAVASPTPLSADGPLDSVLSVAGRVGAVPVLTLRGELAPASGVHTDTLTQGTGRSVAAHDAVLLSVATFSGTTGENTTGTRSGTRLYRGLLEPAGLGEALAGAVNGATEGSRLVLRAPVTSDDGTVSTEVTVVDVLPTLADGEAHDAPQGAPRVSVDQDGGLHIDVSGTTAPASSSAATLIEGSGQQVTDTDRVIARYAAVGWDAGVRSTTYGDTVVPGVIDMTSTMAGIASSLVDVPVGSRVLLRLTADQARGDEPLVVVIDVLGVVNSDQLPEPTASPEAGTTPSPTSDPVVVVTPRAEATPTATASTSPRAGATTRASQAPTGR